jgi:hypothetical protein
MSYLKTISAIVLLISSLNAIVTYEVWWFMQNVNLIFHEAGHIFLMFFGRLPYLLGGTIFEIGVPLVVTIYFWCRAAYFSAGFAAWWLSTAFVSVSIYAADARTRALPLITGDPDTHDWFQILSDLNLLRYDTEIGGFFLALACLSVILAAFCFYSDRDIGALLKPYKPEAD